MATVRANDEPEGTRADHSQSNAAITEAGREAAPMLKRASVHRDRIDQAIRSSRASAPNCRRAWIICGASLKRPNRAWRTRSQMWKQH